MCWNFLVKIKSNTCSRWRSCFKLNHLSRQPMFGRPSPSAYGTSSTYGNRASGSTYSNPYQGNSPAPNSGSSNQYSYGPTNNNPKLGSNRVINYDHEKLPSSLSSLPQWKGLTPNSISLRQQTMHLSPVELRAEDYFSIRNRQLDSKVSRDLDNYVTKGAFNKQLLNQNTTSTLKPLPSFSEMPPRIDDILRLGGGGTGASRYGSASTYGNNTYGSYGNNSSSASTYGRTGGNPFANSGSTYGNNNSGGYGNNSSGGYGSGNAYGNNSYGNNSQGGNNPFSNNNSSYGNNNGGNRGGNPFSNNNSGGGMTSSYNTRSNNPNPFSNNNTGNNPFNNNNSYGNNSYGNNSYGNNSYGNNNSNPFNNNNNRGGNNPFNNNNNGNNPFNNNNNGNNPFNNNNNGGNNLFNNSNNRGGNNLFSNNGNNGNMFNNGGGGGNGLTEFTVCQMLGMMQTMMNNMAAKTNPNSRADDSSYSDPKQLHSAYDWFKDPYPEDTFAYGPPRRQEPKQTIIIRESPPTADLLASRRDFSSSFRRNSSIDEGKTFQSMEPMSSKRGVKYEYEVYVMWMECMQEETCVSGSFQLQNKCCLSQLERTVLENVLNNNGWVRQDAKIVLEVPRQTEQWGFKVQGSITHRKINLPEEYQYLPQKFEGFEVEGLVIQNKHAKVEWPGKINIEGIDFSRALCLEPTEADIIDDRLNDYRMEITMYQLPRNVEKYLPDEGRAEEALKRTVGKIGPNVSLIFYDIGGKRFTFRVEPIQS